MKADKNLLVEQFKKVWPRDKKMVDYCVGKVAAVAILPCGGIVTVDKSQIEKDFCFGESGYDYDEAQRMAAHARTSESYFKWCVWDNLRRCWSPYFCHGVYRTQKAARLAIVRGNEKWSEYLNKGVKYYGKR